MMPLARLRHCETGAAAAEMALVTPLLLVVLFGAVELGKYFMDEHVVIEAVRDGARFAARQSMLNFASEASGCSTAVPAAVEQDIKDIVRTGNLAGTDSRLPYWTDDSTITVESNCSATSGGEDMTGIYAGVNFGGAPVGAPVVTVSASVPYQSLFGLYTFDGPMRLNAEQQASVTGQ